MPPDEPSTESTQRRIAAKRKRETPASRLAEKRKSNASTPNAYSRRSPPREAPRDPPPDPDDDGDRSPPRKLKRPGGGSRVATVNREAAERDRRQREEETRRAIAERQRAGVEVIAEHYNAVPERGREWRSTESKIAGLRSLNNWIKSTLIQKFSRPEVPVHDMKVLDMACGKGGDLGKWKKAPQIPVLYVGCDIASVSINDARKRYEEDLHKSRGRPPRMQAEFYVQDTFARSLMEIPIIRNVGFNPNSGPGPMIIQGGMMSGGFDVVSMMFALHYSFESEELARGMLRNVSGALKKGGRFIGVMPNSDTISAQVKSLLAKESSGKTPNGTTPGQNGAVSSSREPDDEEDDWDPEKPSEPNGEVDEDEWDPEKPSEPVATTNDEGDDDWDPEKPSEPVQELKTDGDAPKQQPQTNGESHVAEDPDLPPLEWKNEIYSVRFPRQQTLVKKHLPKDGIFRPPFGWKYHYHLEEAVEAPEFVVPWEAFRALAEDYGLELLYRKGFRDVFEHESVDRELGELAKRMRVVDNNGNLKVSEQEMEAASFYHAFCFYKT
ncbi:mRNA cap guanine-N7 methyltransferase [Lecanosticta acicola]|uniref:mRNA cap guanine-N(7) methyltransferase n=1 Tax=Lecanosticta acicola TaxID=111012 RepID=A0AAI9E9F4_9PEZI|nr:mRNA cap guanine-N7 methyltransferase [Lecanosticta acicola]